MRSFYYRPSDVYAFGKEYYACFSNVKRDLKKFLPIFINKYKSFVYIVDKNLPPYFLNDVVNITGVKAYKNVIYVDPSDKTIERVIKMWDKMVKFVPEGAIVIGGGTIGDLSGFACGTYQRSIPRFYFPTTVLSMVDASLGGKSGLDHFNVKNSIGVIHYPDIVINYTPFLQTLDKKEYCSGFGEIIKAAVLYRESFFNKLERFIQNTNIYQFRDKETLDIFFEPSLIKAKICEEPTNGKIKLLYGHAVGQAYEKLTNGHKRHGDCVAIGMVVEGALSVILGLLRQAQWERLVRLIIRFNLPYILPENIDIDALLEKMLRYKKLVNEENYLFCLPDRIGHINNQEKSCITAIKKKDMKELLMRSLFMIKENSYSYV